MSWLVSRQTFWVSIAAVLAFVFLSVASDVFATQQNLFNVTRNFAFVAIIALGMTAVIITGGIDLSVGRGARAVRHGDRHVDERRHALLGWRVPLALGASLLVGGFNGVMIAYVGMPPFVVTLGMMSIARSLAMVLSNNRMVYEFGPDQAQLLALGGGFISVGLPFSDAIQVPNPVLFLIVMALITGFAFRWTQVGPPRLRHRRQRGGGEPDRRPGPSREGERLHVLQRSAPASPASSRSAGSARSPRAWARAWS